MNKELIKELRDFAACEFSESYGDMQIAMAAAADALESPWIPVSERLPEAPTDVLAYCRRHGVKLEYYGFKEWEGKIQMSHAAKNGHHYDETDFATHWMPLPSPPQ